MKLAVCFLSVGYFCTIFNPTERKPKRRFVNYTPLSSYEMAEFSLAHGHMRTSDRDIQPYLAWYSHFSAARRHRFAVLLPSVLRALRLQKDRNPAALSILCLASSSCAIMIAHNPNHNIIIHVHFFLPSPTRVFGFPLNS